MKDIRVLSDCVDFGRIIKNKLNKYSYLYILYLKIIVGIKGNIKEGTSTLTSQRL